jgi:hypothetical protein
MPTARFVRCSRSTSPVGRKAPLKVQKRTNESYDDWSKVAAVRFPGAGPVVLAEGVETALSIWQATSRKSWACLGIANIGRAPLPDECGCGRTRRGYGRQQG